MDPRVPLLVSLTLAIAACGEQEEPLCEFTCDSHGACGPISDATCECNGRVRDTGADVYVCVCPPDCPG
jgi:hypothetical protein